MFLGSSSSETKAAASLEESLEGAEDANAFREGTPLGNALSGFAPFTGIPVLLGPLLALFEDVGSEGDSGLLLAAGVLGLAGAWSAMPTPSLSTTGTLLRVSSVRVRGSEASATAAIGVTTAEAAASPDDSSTGSTLGFGGAPGDTDLCRTTDWLEAAPDAEDEGGPETD